MKALLPLILLAGSSIASAQTVYDFNDGINGSITLAAGTTGQVSPADIVSFDFISGPPNTLIAPLSGTEALAWGPSQNGMLSVANGNLYFDPPFDNVGSENLDGYYGIVFDNANRSVTSPQPYFEITDDPGLQGGIGNGMATEDVLNSDQELAADPPSLPAPEISSEGLAAALTLLAGVLLVSRGRRSGAG
jgi:hypothetical protein